MPDRNWLRRLFTRQPIETLDDHLADTEQTGPRPPDDSSPAPWADYMPKPGDPQRDQNTFYGPHPDSPDGIASAKILNKRNQAGIGQQAKLAEEQERRRRERPASKGSDTTWKKPMTWHEVNLEDLPEGLRESQLGGVVLPQSTATVVDAMREARDEPPRMYALRRRHFESGFAELQSLNRTDWTSDIPKALIAQAHQITVPENEKPWIYDLVAVDSLLWERQRDQQDAEYEGVFL